MNVSKSLTSALAAASIVGVVSLAYAQATDAPSSTGTTTSQGAAVSSGNMRDAQTPPAVNSPTAPSAAMRDNTTSGKPSSPPAATDAKATSAGDMIKAPSTSSRMDNAAPSSTTDMNTAPAEPAPKADRN